MRKLRMAADLTQAGLCRRVHVTSARVNQIERTIGHRPTHVLAQALDDALEADGVLVELRPFLHREAYPDYVRAYFAGDASGLRSSST